MGKYFSVLWGVTWRITAFLAVLTVGLLAMNHRSGWDARAAYEKQDAKLEGRVGVIVVALAMPEAFDPTFFENFIGKIFSQTIPWPINVLAGGDAGIALLDPNNSLASKRFEPKELADIWGRTADIDGIPWIEKYRQGKVRWVAPSKTVAFDGGFFLYPERKGGIRTAAAKTILKARYTLYARLPNGYLPHYSQTIAMGNATIANLKAHHNIVSAEIGDAFQPWKLRQAVRRVLDSGIDTLVLASVQPIYSDFEELRGSYPKVYKLVEEWKAEKPGRRVKIVIAPYMASHQSFDTLWAEHLAQTAPSAKVYGVSTARVIVALHGLPVSLVNSDSWTPRSVALVNRMRPALESVMREKGFGKVEVVYASEGFADNLEDPKNKLVSVAEAFRQAAKDNTELAIALPVEFLSENTDTLFTHASVMFDGKPGYTSYQSPPANVNWAKPYVRRFLVGKTEIIYSGALGGDKAAAAGDVLANAIATLWSNNSTPINIVTP